MCYSAQVIQLARKLERQFPLRLDFEEAERLFYRRLHDPAIIISRGFEANFEEPADHRGRRIKQAIDEHRRRLTVKLEAEMFAQRTRLVRAERALRSKQTKKSRDELGIATRKVEALGIRLSELRRADPAAVDDRIFPMTYAGVIIEHLGNYLLTPMRYACRPAGKPAYYDKKFPGLYNARRDNLDKFWSGQFGRHHAVLVAESFYENVQLHAMQHRPLGEEEKPQNVVLQLTPQPPQSMLIACLWSHWIDPAADRAAAGEQAGAYTSDVRGFAAITDEPPPAIAAAGHDRCIINLRWDDMQAWLNPTQKSVAELQAILSEHAVSIYAHAALEAA